MKLYYNRSFRMARRHSGAALVITLAMLILVSFVVVAFLGRSTREAVLVGGAVGGQKADLLANSVSELIVADLKKLNAGRFYGKYHQWHNHHGAHLGQRGLSQSEPASRYLQHGRCKIDLCKFAQAKWRVGRHVFGSRHQANFF